MTQRVFIVGMYKSGTSWLLSAMAKLPRTLAIREIDILKAVSQPDGAGHALRSPEERVEYVFGGTAWCGLPVDYLRPGVVGRFLPELENAGKALRVGELPPEMAIRALQRMFAHRRQRGTADEPPLLRDDGNPRSVPVGRGTPDASNPEPVAFQSVDAAGLREMFRRIRDAQSVKEAAEAFVGGLEAAHPEAKRIVLKGADQLARFDLLQQWVPDAKKILIVRDGRDVAISASHYRSLMDERRMPWRERARKDAGLLERTGLGRLLRWGGGDRMLKRRDMSAALQRWAARISRALVLAREGKLLLIRYEDLSRDFVGTFARVLDWIGEPMSVEQMDDIARQVSFANQTGRDRGEVRDQEVKRSGTALGWVNVLDERDRELVWRVAGNELQQLGYTRDGSLMNMNLDNDEST